MRKWRLMLAALAMALPAQAQAAVRTFDFVSDTFGSGGVVSGSFSGDDLDSSGVLDFGELQSFDAAFSGSGWASPFSLSQANLASFSYDYSGNFATGTNAFWAYDTMSSADISASPTNCGQVPCFFMSDPFGNQDIANGGGTITERLAPAPGVPGPVLGAGLIPALAAFGGLAALRRRRRSGALAPA